jgi:uncharacterized protein (DUF58 family)
MIYRDLLLEGRGEMDVLKQRRPWYGLTLFLFITSIVTQQPLFFLATLLTLLIALVPDIWYLWGLRRLVVSQEIDQQQLFFGEEAVLSVKIENQKLLPLPWLKVENKVAPSLTLLTRKGTELQTVLKDDFVGTWLLWSFQRVTRNYRMRCLQRGFYVFGPLRLSSSDPFGWLEAETLVPVSTTLLVYPLYVPIEMLSMSAVFPLGEKILPRPLLEDPLRFAGVREYMPGDDPRRIHWKASAHAGSLESKLYESPAASRLLILLDVWNYSEAARGRDLEIQELTIAAAASLALWALDERYSVGLLANCTMVVTSSEQTPSVNLTEREKSGFEERKALLMPVKTSSRVVSLPFSSDNGQAERILSTLACLVPRQSSSIGVVIEQEAKMFPRGTTVFLVSAASTLSESTVERLVDQRRRGVAVHLALTGDFRPESLLDTYDLPVHYLGGKRKWHELIAASTSPGHEGSAEEVGGFQLD